MSNRRGVCLFYFWQSVWVIDGMEPISLILFRIFYKFSLRFSDNYLKKILLTQSNFFGEKYSKTTKIVLKFKCKCTVKIKVYCIILTHMFLDVQTSRFVICLKSMVFSCKTL